MPAAEVGVDAAGRVREDDELRAEPLEQQHRLDHQAGVVALVDVEAALQHDHRGVADQTDEQPSDVAGRRGRRPARQLVEWDRERVRQLIDQAAEAGAEDDTRHRPDVGPGADRGFQGVNARGLLGGRDGPAGVVRGHAGLQERVQGVDGRGPRLRSPDGSIDTGMPIASRRANNPRLGRGQTAAL